MTAPPVSVAIVSRGRPQLLLRCLTGVGQLCYPDFEIVVAADAAGRAALHETGWDNRVKLVAFDAANISAARNAAIAEAAGDIVAFIDDDAVPEPSWLDHLAAPFAEPGIAATGGYVIGRNGISFQWTARAVDRHGRKIGLDHDGDAPFAPVLPEGFVTKTEGTNFAVRRDWLARLGGFDPAFRFYLDETDLNLRLAGLGGHTMIVPRAIVHHGYAASTRRAGDRAPRDLTEIGASCAVFLRKHAPDCDFHAEQRRVGDEHRAALLRYMVDGGLEPRDVSRRLAELRAGFAEGLRREITAGPPLATPGTPFRRYSDPHTPRPSRYVTGRPWNRRSLQGEARSMVAAGAIVTVFRFSPTALPHRVRFHDGGWWEQRGGLFGRAGRDEPFFRLHSLQGRAKLEWARVAKLRHCQRNVTKS